MCLRSKAVWGYDDAFLRACRPVLQLAPNQVAQGLAVVAEVNGRLVGVVQVSIDAGTAELDLLFIEPTAQRLGVGRRLYDWAIEAAVVRGATTMGILADPGARAFYERMGAVWRHEAPSDVIAGRTLPWLEHRLPPASGRGVE